MSERSTGQLSMADALVRQREGLNKRLERMGALIDWSRVEASLAPLRRGRMRSTWPRPRRRSSASAAAGAGLARPRNQQAR